MSAMETVDGMKGTYDEVGNEQRPFESIPPQLGSGPATLFAKPTTGDTVIIVVAFTRHSGFIASKSLSSSTLLR